MKFYFFIPVIIIYGISLSCSAPSNLDIVLQNALLIDPYSGEIKKSNISISNGQILQITDDHILGTEVIDLSGKYVLPGFWDMHVHTHGNKKALLQFVENGVIGIRDMGSFSKSNVDSLVKWKKEGSLSKRFEVPEIYYAGLINSDSTCYAGHNHIGSTEELVASMDYLREIGSSIYKIHNCFPDEWMPKLDSLSALYQFNIVGHIPEGLDPIQYCKYNISSIEHIGIPLRALSFRSESPVELIEGVNLLDGTYLDSLARIMVKNNIAFSPNLLSEKIFLNSYSEEQRPMGEALFQRYLNYTKRLSDLGVMIFVSTDTGLENIEPGISLYQEMALLHEAGLDNLKIIQAATINPLLYLNHKDHSKIYTPGSQANLIIFDHNPLEDLALSHVYAICHNGKIFFK